MMRLSLAQRIMAITAAALLPILGALAFNEVALGQGRGAEIRNLALAMAKQAAQEMERLTSGADSVLHNVDAAPVVQRFDARDCTDVLERLMPALPQLTRISVLDLEGVAVCGSDPAVQGIDVSDRPYFVEALANGGRLVVGKYTVSRVLKPDGLGAGAEVANGAALGHARKVSGPACPAQAASL